jgi:hypothetical protein
MRSPILWVLFLGALALPRPAWADKLSVEQCIAANEEGQDLRRVGKLQEAGARFAMCGTPRCPSPLREDCVARLLEARRALAIVAFVAKDENGTLLPQVRVAMDGTPLPGRADGSEIGVDPGDHVFEFAADGRTAIAKRLVVREGTRQLEEVVVPLAAPKEAPSRGSFGLTGDGQRLVALIAGGAGLSFVSVGAVVGVVSAQDSSVAAQGCPVRITASCGQTLQQRANHEAIGAAILAASGLLLIGGGAYLYITAPRDRTVSLTPSLSLGAAGLRLTVPW